MGSLDALRDNTVLFDAAARGRVRVTGADARAFLHRLSTNHVTALAGGQGRLNVLTTDKGRIVDVVHHLDRGDAGVLLVGSPGKGPAIHAWLDRYLFSEKVELADVSAEGTCVEAAGRVDAPPPWGFVEDGRGLVVRTFDRVDATGARVPCVIVVSEKSGGPVDGAARATGDEAEAARIAAGVPGAGELNERFNPLDLGLHDGIHWNKGCYIGQEVIARLDTYQKQHKVLATLRVPDTARARLAQHLAQPASSGAAPAPQVLVDGVVVGEVTSAAPFTWGERPNALCVAKVAGKERAQVKLGDDVVEALVAEPATKQAPHD